MWEYRLHLVIQKSTIKIGHLHPMNVQKDTHSLPSEGIIVVESNVDTLRGRAVELDRVETSPPLDQRARTG